MTTTRCSRAKDEAMNGSGKFHLEANPWGQKQCQMIFPKNVNQNMKFTWEIFTRYQLGGGFECFLFSPLFGEDSQFDVHIFQRG